MHQFNSSQMGCCRPSGSQMGAERPKSSTIAEMQTEASDTE